MFVNDLIHLLDQENIGKDIKSVTLDQVLGKL